jgi:hypothetical protein
MGLCGRCDRPFHLRDREDVPGEDCGEVWVNEQYLTLEYACHECLGKAAGKEPPVATAH